MIRAYSKSLSFTLLVCFLALKPLIAQNKISQIVDKNKISITDPFIYDGFVLTQFTMNDRPKLMQTEFTAFKGQEYKLYFCTSDFSDTLNITVFDTDKAKKGTRENIFNAKTKQGETLTFELHKKGNYTIEYAIPTCENAEYGMTKNECAIVLISYKKK